MPSPPKLRSPAPPRIATPRPPTLRTASPEPIRWERSDDRPDELDLGVRLFDVRRISRRCPAWRLLMEAGADPDDVLQELLVRLVERQRPESASKYDPKRAGVARYLHVACQGILMNIHEKHALTRRGRLEQVGATDRYGAPCDAADVAIAAPFVAFG